MRGWGAGGRYPEEMGEGGEGFLDQVSLRDMTTNSKEGHIGHGCVRSKKVSVQSGVQQV